VNLSAGAVDDFSTFFEFTWDFGDESDLATGANVTHTYEAPGTYLVTAIATSNQGDTGQASIAIVVTGEGPDANFTADPTRGNAPLTVSFDASGSTAGDNAITDYTWDFGDGDTGTGITVEHTYDTPGTYAAKLTITADTGATGTTTRLITVTGSTSTAFESAEDRDVPIAMGCGAGMVGSLTGATMALLGLMLVRRK
jgi:PKD repeat protein